MDGGAKGGLFSAWRWSRFPISLAGGRHEPLVVAAWGTWHAPGRRCQRATSQMHSGRWAKRGREQGPRRACRRRCTVPGRRPCAAPGSPVRTLSLPRSPKSPRKYLLPLPAGPALPATAADHPAAAAPAESRVPPTASGCRRLLPVQKEPIRSFAPPGYANIGKGPAPQVLLDHLEALHPT